MKLFALGIVTIILLVCNIFFGAVSFPASEILDVITGQRPDDDILRAIIIEGRLPQALTALMAGAALAASGLMLQTVFRNPLAGPSILGITSGASLGVALVLLLSGGVIDRCSEFGWQPGNNGGSCNRKFCRHGITVSTLGTTAQQPHATYHRHDDGIFNLIARVATLVSLGSGQHTELRDVGHGNICQRRTFKTTDICHIDNHRITNVDAALQTA